MERYPVEPFTEAQEKVVYLYRRLEEAESNPKLSAEHKYGMRLRLASLNKRNGWTMAQVAEASRLNYWPGGAE